MSINLEQIDLIRERVNVSYEEAKDALEKCNGDVVEALVYLEKQDKYKAEEKTASQGPSFKDTVKDLIKKGNENKFVIKKNEKTVLNVPVNAAIIASVVVPPAAIVGAAAALITKHTLKVEKPDGSDSEVNKVFDTVSEAVNTAAEKVSQAIHKDDEKK